jgi:hypothetical protein
MKNDDLVWDRVIGEYIEKDEYARRKRERKKAKTAGHFVAFSYEKELTLAKVTRNCLIAVQAELYHLHWKNWDKSKPIALGNSVIIQSLGFSNKQKRIALEDLENAGWIQVEWREKRSPLVTFVSGFQFLTR